MLQILNVGERDLPINTDTLIISGADTITFEQRALSELKDVRLIYLTRNKNVRIKSFASVELTVVNLFMEVDRSENVEIEQKAFNKIKGML